MPSEPTHAGQLEQSPLGKTSTYVDQYAPSLLFPIPRAGNRALLSAGTQRPAYGVDIWTGYELSWLNSRGKPCVATATFVIPAESPNLIESKSFKLYLNSLNQSRFNDADELRDCLTADLSIAAGASVEVALHSLTSPENTIIAALTGSLLDELDIECDQYQPDAALLGCTGNAVTNQVWVSHLLKSNCPVTGQPDWGSVQIAYRGREIDAACLLRYIVSFRQHSGFHEHCVERIFDDIMRICQPDELTVYARYTRRGGLDINPWRSTGSDVPTDNLRSSRQ